MFVAFFARADHPGGYGGCYNQGLSGMGAHGYVCLAVVCATLAEQDSVIAHLATKPYIWPGRNGDKWYDGKMDYLCSVRTDSDIPILIRDRAFATGFTHSHRSIGDNRAFAYVAADEVLNQ